MYYRKNLTVDAIRVYENYLDSYHSNHSQEQSNLKNIIKIGEIYKKLGKLYFTNQNYLSSAECFDKAVDFDIFDDDIRKFYATSEYINLKNLKNLNISDNVNVNNISLGENNTMDVKLNGKFSRHRWLVKPIKLPLLQQIEQSESKKIEDNFTL